MSDRCPTCGQRVEPVSDPEGTSHYEGVAEREVERLREALEPFADPYNWHHNYDGHGVIFQIGHGDRPQEQAIQRAKTLVAAAPPARVNEEDGS